MTNIETTANRLFIGVYPGGVVYADRMTEEHGDYKRLAFLSYSTLNLELNGECPTDLQERIIKNADEIIKRKSQTYITSGTGQAVILGQ